jgi:hypothetical protein
MRLFYLLKFLCIVITSIQGIFDFNYFSKLFRIITK